MLPKIEKTRRAEHRRNAGNRNIETWVFNLNFGAKALPNRCGKAVIYGINSCVANDFGPHAYDALSLEP